MFIANHMKVLENIPVKILEIHLIVRSIMDGIHVMKVMERYILFFLLHRMARSSKEKESF
jgi:hypothetical protein